MINQLITAALILDIVILNKLVVCVFTETVSAAGCKWQIVKGTQDDRCSRHGRSFHRDHLRTTETVRNSARLQAVSSLVRQRLRDIFVQLSVLRSE